MIVVMARPPRILAPVFRKDMQDRLHHGPYRLGPSQRCILFLDPGIERGKLRGLQANSYKGSFSGGGRPPALLCYHGVTFHENHVITKARRAVRVKC